MPCSHKPSLTTEKKPGSAFCVARSPERPPAPKSYCASVGFFAFALLTPCKPSLTTERRPGSAFCVARSPDRPVASKSYCATVGFFACALLTPYKPSFTTEKKPGSAFCAAKPLKKPLAAKSYYSAVGISLAGLACHILCPYLQALALKAEASSLPGLGIGLRPSTQCIEARIHDSCTSVFVLGLVVLSRGRAFKGSNNPHSKPYFHIHSEVRFPGPEPQ